MALLEFFCGLASVEFMKTRIFVVGAAISVAMFAGGCATSNSLEAPVSFKASTVDGAVKASNAFGFDFYRKARKGRDNFVCSPAGAAISLTMAAAGARGETQAEMLRTLHIDPAKLDQTYASFAAILIALKSHDGKDGLVLNVADRVWVQKGLKLQPDYLSLLGDGFRAPLAEVDFTAGSGAALSAINQWSSDETHGRIRQILEHLSEDALLVLANAVYMMGEWQQPFVESATYDGKFTTGKKKTTIRMMRQVSSFRYARASGVKLVELPYKGGLSMQVVLPDDVDGLEKIENRLGSSYAEWVEALEYKRVDLELPRFVTPTTLPLVGLLKEMGIRLAFTPDRADFSGVTGTAPLYIDDAIQKAWIATNERGTEAAAVTVVVMAEGVSEDAYPQPPPPPPVIFHADHPFIYLIRDVKSGAILFLGRMVKPAE
jgi:serpin B